LKLHTHTFWFGLVGKKMAEIGDIISFFFPCVYTLVEYIHVCSVFDRQTWLFGKYIEINNDVVR